MWVCLIPEWHCRRLTSEGNQNRKHSLAYAVCRTFALELWWITIPRMALVGFSIAQPFLVQTTLVYITNSPAKPPAYGYGLIGAYGLTYVGLAVSGHLPSFLGPQSNGVFLSSLPDIECLVCPPHVPAHHYDSRRACGDYLP